MPLRLANLRAVHVDQEPNEDHGADDEGAPELDLTPWFEDSTVLVYIDLERYPTDADVARIVAEYDGQYGDMEIEPVHISRAGLPYRRTIAFPNAQAAFLRRGYVSSREFRKASRGNQPETAYLEAHKACIHTTTLVLDNMLRCHGAAFFGWSFEQEAQVGENPETLADFLRRKTLEALGPLTGGDSVPDGDERTTYALVEYGRLLLGRDHAGRHDTIHMASPGTPGTFLKYGRARTKAGHVGDGDPDEVSGRIAFETSPPALAAFFNPAHWPTTGAQLAQHPVTPAMLMTWYSQCLTSLRKLAWRAWADESTFVLTNELIKEGDRRVAAGLPRVVGGERRPRGRAVHDFGQVMNTPVDRFLDTIPGSRAAATTFTLCDRDIVVGKVFGTDIDLEDGISAPPAYLELASWIGLLRRTGTATIDGGFLDNFDDLTAHAPNEIQDLLLGLLAEPVWQAILSAAQAIARSGDSIVARYRWADVVEAPWDAHLEGGELLISGPFLIFPVLEASDWAAKGAWLRENRDFIAPVLGH